ncbi:MAG: DNA gyrase inhibitor YacG [Motiliproteus sp.]
MKQIPCPNCQKPVNLSEKTPYRPFCSERCRLLDLGAWASDEYQVSSPSHGEDNDNLMSEDDIGNDWPPSELH